MKKRILFIILLIICAALFLIVRLYDGYFCRKAASAQTAPGLFTANSSVSPFDMDFYLAGEWEFYPGELIFSDHSGEHVTGKIPSLNPIDVHNRFYYHQETPFPENGYALDHSSIELNPNAQHITIPARHLFQRASENSITKASYRIIIRGIEQVDDGKQRLCLAGLTNGNNRIFINGTEAACMSSPYGYPVFSLPMTEDVEIVIETANTSQILNICPRLCYIGIAMTYMDASKNIYILLSALVLASLLILIISSVFTDAPQYRFWSIAGFFFSGFYILNTCWVSGYLDTITSFLPVFALNMLSHLLFLFGTFTIFIIIRKYYGEYYPLVYCRFSQLCCMAVIALRCLTFSTPISVWMAAICTILFILPIIGWIIHTLRCIHKLIWEQALLHYGIMLLLTGTGISLLHNHFGFSNNFIYILPSCLIAFIVLAFSSGSLDKQRTLDHTRQLLHLEKNIQKMQTSMLANQIKPHFLYNTLTTIQEMCYTNPEQAAELIVYFSNYLRTNIDFMETSDLIPFSRELDHIQNYMHIQNARFHNSIHFETELRTKDFMIPPLSVQPVVENAVKYGIRRNSNQGWVHLETREDLNFLYITVENSGPGFHPDLPKAHHSIENIRIRLDSLLHARLIIESEEGVDGTRIEICIPRVYLTYNHTSAD